MICAGALRKFRIPHRRLPCADDREATLMGSGTSDKQNTQLVGGGPISAYYFWIAGQGGWGYKSGCQRNPTADRMAPSDSPDPPNEEEITKAMFGRLGGGVPKDVREQLRFAADAINAHEHGMSVPQVALNYRYEPIQAMTMVATCCQDYGFSAVAALVPKHVMSLVQAQYPDAKALHPPARPPRSGGR